MHFPSYLFNEKIPAEIAGNGISEPLNFLKKKFWRSMPPSEVQPFFPSVHLQNLKLRPWKHADVHATSNKKINAET